MATFLGYHFIWVDPYYTVPPYCTGAVLGGVLEFPETPAHTPTIRLGDKNYKELYILWLFLFVNFILLLLKSPSQR